VHRFAGAEQRLRRDAGVVRALAAAEFPFDDGDPESAFGECAGAVFSRRTAADDDHVVLHGVSSH
jgi:hypothetical protein